MKAIIIAAGPGKRLLPLTENKPKCMLDVGGKTILERTMETLRACGVNEIVVIRGWQKDKINYPGVKYYYNDNYMNNNILASLFYAKDEMDDDVIVTYSDILFDKEVVEKLLQSGSDISIIIDTGWVKRYDGRTKHPLSEAEKVLIENGKVIKIGKIMELKDPTTAYGEFIGLAKFSKKGAKILRENYERLAETFAGKPFQKASVFENAYLTDMIQELIDRGHTVRNVDINGNWFEIDTDQDFERARKKYGQEN
jgi:phosphoenolpyruvate phosphomutase